MNQLEPIQVECYAGYKADESPRAFVYKNRRYNIVLILDRWYAAGVRSKMPQLDYYKVKADDSREYIIRYNHLFDKWALVVKLPV
jgi:hypothetical protein